MSKLRDTIERLVVDFALEAGTLVDTSKSDLATEAILELIKGECNKARVEILKEILKAPREMFGWFEFRQDLEEQLAQLDKLEDKS